MIRAHRVKVEEIEFVAPGIPRGMITVVSGRPGEGKSTWACDLAAQVSQFAPVILSNHEDPVAQVVKPRLEAAGAVLRRVFMPETPFMLPNDIGALERKVTQLGAALVVCDSALQHLSPTAGSGQDIRKALTPLKQMLERTGCAIVFIDHLKKHVSRNAHPLEALTGAGSGLPAAARFVYAFGRNPKDPDERILAPVKVNAIDADHSFAYEMEGAAVFTHDGKEIEVGRIRLVSTESDVDASEVVSFNGGGKAGSGDSLKRAIASEWLVGALMFGPMPAKEIEVAAAEAGFSWSTVSRAGKAVEIVRKREGFGPDSKVVWRLPDGHKALEMAAKMSGQLTVADVLAAAGDGEEA